MIAFARTTTVELKRAREAKLNGREYAVWLAAKAIGHNGWAIKCRALEQETGLSRRHLLLVLSALERKGFVRRNYAGNRKDPWGRFVIETSIESDPSRSIESDRSGSIESDPCASSKIDRKRSISTFLGSDQRNGSQISDPKIDDVSSIVGVQGDERTNVLDQLERTARELWPEMARAPTRRFVARLIELAPFAPLDRLAAYLRHSHATITTADIPLAVACTPDRWDAWAKRRRRPASTPDGSKTDPPGETLSAAELAELAAREARRR